VTCANSHRWNKCTVHGVLCSPIHQHTMRTSVQCLVMMSRDRASSTRLKMTHTEGACNPCPIFDLVREFGWPNVLSSRQTAKMMLRDRYYCRYYCKLFREIIHDIRDIVTASDLVLALCTTCDGLPFFNEQSFQRFSRSFDGRVSMCKFWNEAGVLLPGVPCSWTPMEWAEAGETCC